METLREAARYIAQLRAILGEDFSSAVSSQSPSFFQQPAGNFYPPQNYQPEISPCNTYYSSDSSFDEPQQKFFAH